MAGNTTQQSNAVAVGYAAGSSNQGPNAVAIGDYAGNNEQNLSAIAIGNFAGSVSQNSNAVAIGDNAGASSQGGTSVAVGYSAGKEKQGIGSVAIGPNSGFNTQGTNSIAIGYSFGQSNQNNNSIAIGSNAGNSLQGPNSIALGSSAGADSLGDNSIVIGNSAGNTNTSGFSNYTIINSTGSVINPSASSSLKIAPIRTAPVASDYSLLFYKGNEVFVSGVNTSTQNKTFVIDHPKDTKKYLVHACLEGPEKGIYYRGKGQIINDIYVEIELPDYVNLIGRNFTIQITKIYSSSSLFEQPLETTEIVDGKFKVYGYNCSFYWTVFGERNHIETEPNKEDYELRGDGPYTYISKK